MNIFLGILAILGCIDLIVFIINARGRASDFTSWMCYIFGIIPVPMFVGFIVKLVDIGVVVLFLSML